MSRHGWFVRRDRRRPTGRRLYFVLQQCPLKDRLNMPVRQLAREKLVSNSAACMTLAHIDFPGEGRGGCTPYPGFLTMCEEWIARDQKGNSGYFMKTVTSINNN